MNRDRPAAEPTAEQVAAQTLLAMQSHIDSQLATSNAWRSTEPGLRTGSFIAPDESGWSVVSDVSVHDAPHQPRFYEVQTTTVDKKGDQHGGLSLEWRDGDRDARRTDRAYLDQLDSTKQENARRAAQVEELSHRQDLDERGVPLNGSLSPLPLPSRGKDDLKIVLQSLQQGEMIKPKRQIGIRDKLRKWGIVE